MDVPGQRAVRLLETASVPVESRIALARRAPGVGVDGEARRQRLGALLEQLDAQQLVAERLVEGRRRTAEEASDQGAMCK